jgi:hypothetical protein
LVALAKIAEAHKAAVDPDRMGAKILEACRQLMAKLI